MHHAWHLSSALFFFFHRGNRAQISLETLRKPHIFINPAVLLDISPLRCSQHLNLLLQIPSPFWFHGHRFHLRWHEPKHWRLPFAFACGLLHFFFFFFCAASGTLGVPHNSCDVAPGNGATKKQTHPQRHEPVLQATVVYGFMHVCEKRCSVAWDLCMFVNQYLCNVTCSILYWSVVRA